MDQEFQRQVDNLITKNYPELAGLTEREFLKLLEPLRKQAVDIKNSEMDFEKGYLPFVIVIKSDLVPAGKMMEWVLFNGKGGITKLDPLAPENFEVIDLVQVPENSVYLIVDVDRGKETINVRPEDALGVIQSKHRFPLTIDEGIAVASAKMRVG